MTPGVASALDAVLKAAVHDGIFNWFIAIRDPDSNDRHSRIFGDMEVGFSIAQLAVTDNGIPMVSEDAPNLMDTLKTVLVAAGVETWFFCFQVKDMSDPRPRVLCWAANGLPHQAFGLGVVCLHLMVAGHLQGDVRFSMGPTGELPPPPPPLEP
jgi:hypothetical protein